MVGCPFLDLLVRKKIVLYKVDGIEYGLRFQALARVAGMGWSTGSDEKFVLSSPGLSKIFQKKIDNQR